MLWNPLLSLPLPKKMDILLIGGGGREHAIAWKLRQSPLCHQLYIAPGNPGTAFCGQNTALDIKDFEAVAQFCLLQNVSIVVIGPEEPLVLGLADHLRNHPDIPAIIVCGPGKIGAQLEGSKAFSKAFMERHHIPTAAYREFKQPQTQEAHAFLATLTAPYVIKADGLAAGKGVIICNTLPEAQQAVSDMFGGQFGDAGSSVVIEEFLDGIEFSVFCLTDGQKYYLLPSAKDYKRIGEGDTGPNTGGMGAVSPVPFVDEAMMKKVVDRIVEPTITGLRQEAIPYKGFIFFGLIAVKGEPMVIEYNCRMGDPETEVVMPRLNQDLVALIQAMEAGTLDQFESQEEPQTAMTVMMVSDGYPGNYEKGKVITGLDPRSNLHVFHAGTALREKGLVTQGGRVLACTVLGANIEQCREEVYREIRNIHFEGAQFRKDIGLDLI
jgi:phosphoribosylamine--glycine ligase